ncbi:oleate hydratase [Variovorax sp. H27-G14]|uniref:oleate hydratase n=1 Tax=Variovorax sp. H27-G14 TaxID=3111914 RepID=UPI0038FC007B
MIGINDSGGPQAFIVGAGIAGLATAAYLIRDGCMAGNDIHVMEETRHAGGSLDAHGTADHGYVMRGGRMFDEQAYACTFDLMSIIPSLSDPRKTVKQEFFDFNETFRSHARSRLVSDGLAVDVSSPGFAHRDRLDLIELMLKSETSVGSRRIDDCFQPSFFKTNFWFMWCTTFAFQPWHSAVEFRRYMLRFIQEFPDIDTLSGVRRTPYNQFDSLVRPLIQWLLAQGVDMQSGVQVVDIEFTATGHGCTQATQFTCMKDGTSHVHRVCENDKLFITLGSMTAGSSLGTMTSPARAAGAPSDGSWALWRTISKDRPDFGHPEVFDSHVDQSLWQSFTLTLHDPLFFRRMKEFTGNEAGTGGLVTFKDSNWLMSIVLPHQPHFLKQPEDVYVCWGYGLFPQTPGNFVKKKMSECSGEEILIELFSHLHFDDQEAQLLKAANCIPCMMPLVTSQFLVRSPGDRPAVVPQGAANFAFLGQYCEIADDVVFTVEYSVRSAQMAVVQLLRLDCEVSPIYKGHHDPGVLLRAVKAVLR